MRVLLSIKPEFAERIFIGVKRYEYRRNIFKRPIRHVVVYASAPISKVIGEFEIDEIIYADLDDLWSYTKQYAGISDSYFCDYFRGKEKGYAIKIGRVRLYSTPRNIQIEYGVHPPQSFLYLERAAEQTMAADFSLLRQDSSNFSI